MLPHRTSLDHQTPTARWWRWPRLAGRRKGRRPPPLRLLRLRGSSLPPTTWLPRCRRMDPRFRHNSSSIKAVSCSFQYSGMRTPARPEARWWSTPAMTPAGGRVAVVVVLVRVVKGKEVHVVAFLPHAYRPDYNAVRIHGSPRCSVGPQAGSRERGNTHFHRRP